MKSFLKNILTTIIGIISSIIVMILLIIGFVAIISSEDEVKVKENSILKIDLANTSVVERSSENPFDGLSLSGDVASTIELKKVLDNIEKAKNTLLNSNSPISEIAFDLGFDYPQHFSKLFKSKVGMNPTEYRKLN